MLWFILGAFQFCGKYCLNLGFPDGSEGKVPACSVGDTGDVDLLPGSETPPEEEMVTHSSILAWEIPGSEEPGGLQSIASNYKSEKLASHSSSIHSFISSFAYLFSDYLLSIASKARPWGELCSGTHFSYPVLSLFFCLGVYNEGEWVCVDVWLSPFTVHLKP